MCHSYNLSMHGPLQMSLSTLRRQTNASIPTQDPGLVFWNCMLTRVLPLDEKPSCLQATAASKALQKSSHTVPQALLLQTSTRPSLELLPPTSRMSPVVQANSDSKNITLSLALYMYNSACMARSWSVWRESPPHPTDTRSSHPRPIALTSVIHQPSIPPHPNSPSYDGVLQLKENLLIFPYKETFQRSDVTIDRAGSRSG